MPNGDAPSKVNLSQVDVNTGARGLKDTDCGFAAPMTPYANEISHIRNYKGGFMNNATAQSLSDLSPGNVSSCIGISAAREGRASLLNDMRDEMPPDSERFS